MKRKLIAGDCFFIPIENQKFAVGQIVNIENAALNSVVCAFFDVEMSSHRAIEVQNFNVISVQFVTKDLLVSGKWKVFTNTKPVDVHQFLNLEKLKKANFVGVKVIGSGIIIKFLNAFYGMFPWDHFHDPEYLDKLLVSSKLKPTQRLIFKEKGIN